MRKLTTEEFIERSKDIHGDRYDYSLVEYINGNGSVIIICEKHGEFKQRADGHLRGKNCLKCYHDSKKLTTEEFVEKSISIHGDKYSYEFVSYTTSHKKVDIFCKKHKNIFKMKPNNHLNGNGCPSCKLDNNKKYEIIDLIDTFKDIHDNKYTYNNFYEYKNVSDKIEVNCEKHGLFLISIKSHLYKKRGCPYCRNVDISEFIERSNIIHNSIYDYSSVEFINTRTEVNIRCKEHGIFKIPICKPVCKSSKGEKSITSILESFNIEYERQKKFNGCRYKNKLKFDFFIQSLNICIEYNGRQHYEPNDFFGGEKSFKKQLIRDNIKKEYCENNNIKLIIIRYNEDIDEKLTQYLK